MFLSSPRSHVKPPLAATAPGTRRASPSTSSRSWPRSSWSSSNRCGDESPGFLSGKKMGKSMGKSMGKWWEMVGKYGGEIWWRTSHREIMGKYDGENRGKIMGKIVGKSWENDENMMENDGWLDNSWESSWMIHGYLRWWDNDGWSRGWFRMSPIIFSHD